MIYTSHPMQVKMTRRLLWITPLLTIPFIIILFVALGGGQGPADSIKKGGKAGGLNPKLPDAHFRKGKEKNKLGLYEEALHDSDKIRQQIKIDPYYRYFENLPEDKSGSNPWQIQTPYSSAPAGKAAGIHPGLIRSVGGTAADSNADKVLEKLAQLRSELNKKSPSDTVFFKDPSRPSVISNPELPRLEQAMLQAGSGRTSDPELDKLDGMLEKIMMIQHPEKFRDSPDRDNSNKRLVYHKVQPGSKESVIETMVGTVGQTESESNGFFGEEQASLNVTLSSPVIQAAVDENQTLVSGGQVRLRLLEDIYVENIRIPVHTLIYGNASLNRERLQITVLTIRYRDQLLPVHLDAYDLDGLEGIFVPGSLTRDAAKQSADQAIGNMGFEALDPSLGAQAANAGIQAAKMLMSKKIRLVRVTLKAGYQVLLRDNHRS